MDLVKAFRAMQSTPEWSESVQAACLFANKEFTPELFQAMTKEFLDSLVYDRETFVVFVPVSIGNALLEAVKKWQPEKVEASPALPEEPAPEPDILDEEAEEKETEEIIEGEPDA